MKLIWEQLPPHLQLLQLLMVVTTVTANAAASLTETATELCMEIARRKVYTNPKIRDQTQELLFIDFSATFIDLCT